MAAVFKYLSRFSLYFLKKNRVKVFFFQKARFLTQFEGSPESSKRNLYIISAVLSARDIWKLERCARERWTITSCWKCFDTVPAGALQSKLLFKSFLVKSYFILFLGGTRHEWTTLSERRASFKNIVETVSLQYTLRCSVELLLSFFFYFYSRLPLCCRTYNTTSSLAWCSNRQFSSALV